MDIIKKHNKHLAIFLVLLVICICLGKYLGGLYIFNDMQIYNGIIPCADCEGIDITIKINDDKYETIMKYLGKSDVVTDHGKIEIEGHLLKVGEGYYRILDDGLLKLDMDKHEIKSEFNYKLKLVK